MTLRELLRTFPGHWGMVSGTEGDTEYVVDNSSDFDSETLGQDVDFDAEPGQPGTITFPDPTCAVPAFMTISSRALVVTREDGAGLLNPALVAEAETAAEYGYEVENSRVTYYDGGVTAEILFIPYTGCAFIAVGANMERYERVGSMDDAIVCYQP